MSAKKKALGRGLSQLLGPEPSPAPAAGDIQKLPLDRLVPNPHQPRYHFDSEKLDELAQSIREKGVLQPLVVRQGRRDYEIVAGERRWRAARQAGLSDIPVLIREFSDQEMLEIALIENIQRDALDPIEEARAYRQLVEGFELTQDQVAERVGKSRVAVTNAIRLLKLPEPIQTWVSEGQLSAGHARALLGLQKEGSQVALAREIIRRGLSVREAENRVRRVTHPGKAAGPRESEPSPEIADLEERLTLHLGMQVKINQQSAKSGRVEIRYSSLEEFQRLLDQFGVSTD